MEDESLEQYILQSRTRSRRRKKRAQRNDFEKKLIAVFRERRALRDQIASLGYVPLDPPVQRGWKRSFILRADVARSKDAAFFQRILDKINTTKYSWRKDFKHKKNRKGKKVYEVMPQEFERLSAYNFATKDFTLAEKRFFQPYLVYNRYQKEPETVYIFTESWRFVLKVQPNIITRTRRKDFDLERRKIELEQYIDQNGLEGPMLKIVAGHYQWRNRRIYTAIEKYDDPFRNKPRHAIIEEEYYPHPSMAITKTPDSPGFFVTTPLTHPAGIEPASGGPIRAASPPWNMKVLLRNPARAILRV